MKKAISWLNSGKPLSWPIKAGVFAFGTCVGVLVSSAWHSAYAGEYHSPQVMQIGEHTVAINSDCLLTEVDGEAVDPTSSHSGHVDYQLNNGDFAEVEVFPNRNACKVYVGNDQRLIFISELEK